MNISQMVRDYKENDKEQLRQLVIESNLYQKRSLEKEVLDTEKVRDQTSNLFDGVLQHPEDQHYIVAEIDGKLVGFILVEVSGMYVGRGSVDDLYIQSEYRNKGIGKALLQAAFEWLKDNGVKRVGLGVHKSNEVAIKLYKSMGFEEEPETYLSLEKEL